MQGLFNLFDEIINVDVNVNDNMGSAGCPLRKSDIYQSTDNTEPKQMTRAARAKSANSVQSAWEKEIIRRLIFNFQVFTRRAQSGFPV